MNTMKRLYFYGMAFVALVVTANGASQLLAYLLDWVSGRQIAGSVAEGVSLGLALVVVGAPLWFFHWAYVQRQVERDPSEGGATLRKLYLYGSMFLAAIIVFVAERSQVVWALGSDTFDSIWVGQFVMWGAVWAYHWMVERREGEASPGGRTLRRWYVYVTSVYALVVLGTGIGAALDLLLGGLYDALVNVPLLVSERDLWGRAMDIGLASVITGGVWWAFHWLYLARDDGDSTLRQVYLYLFAFLGGAITILVALGAMVNAVLRWVLGAPGLSDAALHFRAIPTSFTVLVIGGLLLGYHWQVVREESLHTAERRHGAGRTFSYAMSALGLGSLAGGIPILMGLLIGLAVPDARESLAGGDSFRNLLAVALTLLVLGVPLWVWFWPRMQRQVSEVGLEERRALSRRIFIYGVLGVLALAALGSLIGFLFMLLRDLLEGTFSSDFLRDGKWLLGVVLTVGALLSYYLQVLREDQQAGAEAVPVKKSVTLVVGEQDRELVRRLEEALLARVRIMRIASPETPVSAVSDEELEAVVEQVRSAATDRVLVVATEVTVRVFGYR
jgi:hypothetical protein